MGNYFDKAGSNNENSQLLVYLRQLHFVEIQKVQKYVQNNYAATNILSIGEFYDVYYAILKQYCGDMFETIENNNNVDGVIDIYESQAILIVFADADFSVKVKFISQLFDLDNSQKLEKIEIIIIFQTAIRALCKIIGLKPPKLEEIEKYVNTIFKQIDVNNDNVISYEELYDWLDGCYPLQDFLLKYAQVQTFANAKKRTKEILDSNEFATIQNPWLSNFLNEARQSYTKVFCNKLTTTSRVDEEFAYAYSSYMATDINEDGQISIREMPYLVYGYEGVEVSDIKKRFATVDKDKNGFLSLQEWFETLKLNNGIELSINALKRLWLKQDVKKIGAMTNAQIVQLFKETFDLNSHDVFLKGIQYVIDQHFPLDKITIPQLALFVEQHLFKIFEEKSMQQERDKQFQENIEQIKEEQEEQQEQQEQQEQ